MSNLQGASKIDIGQAGREGKPLPDEGIIQGACSSSSAPVFAFSSQSAKKVGFPESFALTAAINSA
jgi:hypothetical protein